MKSQKSLLIKMQNVMKEYEIGEGKFTALNDVNLEIYAGEFLGITGKSGAGKTTLLNMISGVSSPSAGEVIYYAPEDDDQSGKNAPLAIHSLDEDDMALWRGNNVGIVYQSFELMPSLRIIDNIMFPQDLLGSYQPLLSKKQALKILEQVEIPEQAYKYPAHTSGGQKQRVAIARALVNSPPLIIADEPTGNLDSVTAEKVLKIFENLVDQGKTVVMVTHDESLAPRFSRRMHIIDGVVGAPPEATTISIPAPDLEQAIGTDPQNPDHQVSSLAHSASRTEQHEKKSHPAILMRAVEKVFDSPAGKFTALKSVNMQLSYGQFISVVGKSGSGKSTLLNMITGIDHPTMGEVVVGNEKIYSMSESQRALWRGRNMGVVFQFFQLLPTLSLLENTILPMDFCQVYPYQDRPARAMHLLERVGLEEFAHQMPGSVSSGQQQSAAIARALANDPSIILADEPTGNLDSRSAGMILDLFEELAAAGRTVLIVTHDPSITKRTDQTVILSDGEIVDQTIARALPHLTHPQMLAATHDAQRQICIPNEVILRQGQSVDHFYMVVKGEVEVVVRKNGSLDMSLACLGPGQFFGEVELTMGGGSIAGVRASALGAEVALLPQTKFFELIDGSPLTRNSLQQIARKRRIENQDRRMTDR
jgi:ABC-type lipoprotein export system ATPase subunit